MPYTVEHEDDATEIIVMDGTASMEGDSDLHVLCTSGGFVYLQQEGPGGAMDMLVITDKMFAELVEAYNKAEGFYNLQWQTT